MDFATYQNLIQQNKNKTDDNVIARFYDRSVKTNQFDDNGIPVFKTVCYCEIRIKDNTTEVFDQPASKDKKERFPVEYARYELSKKQLDKGTPLEMFAFLSASEIDACRYRGIFSVEALAELSDEHAKNIQLYNECLLARQFISSSQEMKKAISSNTIEASYKRQIADLKKQIEDLKRIINRRRNR
ncbi:MAG: hypothetical protein E7020_02875 [Alphaproteobacteria bacterium]|nr:hypothetical protein [Alphaproteobacteria bacterium]